MRLWIVAITACVAFSACGYSTSIEGLYQASPAIRLDPGATAFYMELVTSQYGPEVGGLVHLFSDKDFLTPLGTYKACYCMPLENAVVKDGVFMFTFELPGACIGTKKDIVFLGYGFKADTKRMTGSMKWRNKDDASWHRLDTGVTLIQEKGLKELTIEDKQCQ